MVDEADECKLFVYRHLPEFEDQTSNLPLSSRQNTKSSSAVLRVLAETIFEVVPNQNEGASLSS